MCQEAGSAISIDALNYPPTVVAQVVLIRSNYEASEVSEVYRATEVTLTEVAEVIEATKVSETLHCRER